MSDAKTTEGSSGSGRGGMHFGGEPTALWGKARREPRFRAEGATLVHANGNKITWSTERNNWVSV